MSTYDLIVRGGYVVDGTGLPRRRVDVGVRDGRVVALARLDAEVAREEPFGPIAPVVPIRGLEHAIDLANALP